MAAISARAPHSVNQNIALACRWLWLDAQCGLVTRAGPVQLIIQIAPLFVLLAVAFGCGYGVREFIAHRRRAAARKKFYDEHPDLRQLRGL
jgi:hypothetical protein